MKTEIYVASRSSYWGKWEIVGTSDEVLWLSVHIPFSTLFKYIKLNVYPIVYTYYIIHKR